jgi:predicted permease
MAMVGAFVPIWLLAAAGYAARRWRLLRPSAVTMLGWFVFHVAMPAALFVTLGRTPLAGFDARPLVAFAASTALVIGAGWYSAKRLFDRKPGERAIWGMAGGYVNSANLGIPVAMQVLGNLSFLVEVVLLQVLVVAPVILVALDRHADAAGRVRLRRIATVPLRNPVILASAAGIACSAAGIHLWPAVLTPLGWLASAAVPSALIALGASLYREEPALDAGRAEISVITALKLLAQPTVAYAAGVLLHLPPAQLLAVVVCAGLPTAQNAFIFAQRYGVGEALASRAVLTTTTLSLVTIAATSALLAR